MLSGECDEVLLSTPDVPVRVQCLVTNKANAALPPLPRWTGAGPLQAHHPGAARGDPAFGNGLGLIHVALAAKAAKASGMEVELWQEEDRVFFRAAFDTVTTTETAAAAVACAPGAGDERFPCGLHIHCLEDSALARQTLQASLGGRMPQSIVKAYGDTVRDVEVFKDAVLHRCDVAIVDQVLDGVRPELVRTVRKPSHLGGGGPGQTQICSIAIGLQFRGPFVFKCICSKLSFFLAFLMWRGWVAGSVGWAGGQPGPQSPPPALGVAEHKFGSPIRPWVLQLLEYVCG